MLQQKIQQLIKSNPEAREILNEYLEFVCGEEYKWEACYYPAGEEDDEQYLFKTKKDAEEFLDKWTFNCAIHTGKKGKERCPSCDAEWGIHEYEDKNRSESLKRGKEIIN